MISLLSMMFSQHVFAGLGELEQLGRLFLSLKQWLTA